MSAQDSGIYAKLSDTIKGRTGVPTDVPVDPVTKQFTPGFVERSIGPNVRETPTSVYNDRVNGRALLLTNPFKENPKDKGRVGDAKLKQKANRKTITAKEKRALKIYEIPEAARKYDLFLPLHEMWSQYISGLIGSVQGKPTTLLNKIVKADMHGAEMTVVKARCPNFVGVSGIVAQETKNTFKFITKGDRQAVVPKAHCVFMLKLPTGQTCKLFGDQFAFRASERATRKFKPKPTVDL